MDEGIFREDKFAVVRNGAENNTSQVMQRGAGQTPEAKQTTTSPLIRSVEVIPTDTDLINPPAEQLLRDKWPQEGWRRCAD